MPGSAAALLGVPRSALTAARRAGRSVRDAVEALPRIVAVLGDVRDTSRQLERLVTFAAQELPEIVYQLEEIRERLAAIERNLAASSGRETGAELR
ncbi:hypothetical protein [Qaidamihabitans albus]|uniref:hypothetical protein n=1 Tax=Qaidamihabitans albus TaxID=2795733 RepID=UPI0018F16E35|nr:hypothetical protein [Qaidamihabitans albus]